MSNKVAKRKLSAKKMKWNGWDWDKKILVEIFLGKQYKRKTR